MSQTSIEIYNTVTDVQVIEVTAGGLTTTADLSAAVTAASGSATAAAASASSASSAASSATASASSATTQAGIATTAATSASASASQAASSAAQAAAVTLQQSFGRKFVPTISLDATSRTVPSYLPCTRAGVATFFDQSGVLRTAANNEGRIDFDPVTGECLGLLSEGSATNLILRSNNFINEYWQKADSIIILDYLVRSPDGVNGVEKLIALSGTGTKNVRRIMSSLNNSRYVISVFAKKAEFSNLAINANVSGYTWISFNLDEGVVTHVENSRASGKITKIGSDGWFLCEWISNGMASSLDFSFSISANPGLSSSYRFVGDGVSGLYIWGATLRTFSNYSSYIPTTTTSITRPADLFQTSGFQFAKRYNQREGTFYVNTRAISDLTSTVATFSDGTTNNETRLLANGTLTIRKGGAQIATIQATGATLNAHSIFGFTYKGTRVVITRNGATVGVVTASEELATNYTQFQLGTGIYVRNLRYVPRAFSDSELQFVTNPLYFVGLEGDKVPTINDLSSGAFMEVQDLQTLRTRSEITIFGSGALRSIVINRPYPFLIEQVYVSPTGVTTATIPTLPAAGFYAANTDYTVLFNATADRTLVLAIIPQTIN